MWIIANIFAGILRKKVIFSHVSKLIWCKPKSAGCLCLFDNEDNTEKKRIGKREHTWWHHFNHWIQARLKPYTLYLFSYLSNQKREITICWFLFFTGKRDRMNTISKWIIFQIINNINWSKIHLLNEFVTNSWPTSFNHKKSLQTHTPEII